MKQRLKQALALLIIVATIVAFIYYARSHSQVIDTLRRLPVATIGLLLLLYTASFLAYAFVTQSSLALYKKSLGRQETILFNAYSSLINFFGPGQSGPVFRGAYLKKRHGLRVTHYVFATLLYYAFFAIISVLMVCAGSRPWWQTLAVLAVAAAVSVAGVKWYKRRHKIAAAELHIGPMARIGLFASLQLVLQAAIYAVELRSVGAHASAGHTLTYAGVANLSVFVALTPGAIGIREAFLLFSQRLHHIGSAAIVAASVVDRGIYLIFLGILFAATLSLHAKKKLQLPHSPHKEGQ